MLSYTPLLDKVIHVEALLLFPAKCSHLEQFKLKFKKREPNPTVAEKETTDNQEWWLAKQNIDHGEWGNNAPHSPQQHNREQVC